MILSNPHQTHTIAQIVQTLTASNATMVEIGAFEGLSTIFLAQDQRIVFAVDPWHWDSPKYGCEKDVTAITMREQGGGTVFFHRFCRNVGDKLFSKIFPIRAYSTEVALIFPYWIDLIFIDGEHTYKAVSADLHAWKRCFKPTTQLVFDDYSEHFDNGGLKRAIDEFCGASNLQSFHPDGSIVHCQYKDTDFFKKHYHAHLSNR
jgi:hypothetical protein